MNFNLPEKIIIIMKKVVSSGGEIFVVGGAVRDMLLGRDVKDWDLTTSLTPDEMRKVFPKNSFYNNSYGTFSIVLPENEVVEVTTYRTERDYTDGRHPEVVEWGKTILEDLERRDFTINAMAVDIVGRIEDPYNGQKDLQDKLVRTVGDGKERFKEDALRMLRGIRIAAELKFSLDYQTLEAMKDRSELIKNIAGERIKTEIFRILSSDAPGDGVKILKNTGLLGHIIPELLEGVEVMQKGHHIYDVWTHGIEALNNCSSKNPVTRLATLIHDIGKPRSAKGDGQARTFHNHEVIGSRIALEIGKRLRFSKKELEMLFKLVRWHMFTVSEIQTDSAVRRFIRNVTPEYIDEMIALRRADRVGSGSKETSWRWELFKKRIVEVQKQPFSVKDLKVNGEDVMNILAIKPSPMVGEVLEALFAKVEIDPSLNSREVLLREIEAFKV